MLRRINIALLVLQWTVCMAGGKEEAGTWQYVTASNPPAERVAPAVIDAQQRIWIFGGLRYAGRYQGVYKGTAFFNDLHYFDTQARAWHEVTASNAPSERNGHTSVIDAQQRIWVFGGYFYSARFNDLHYFDIQAKVWHEVSAQNAPPGRSYHTAVMDAKQRMWIFGGDRPPGQGGYNDLHYFDIQANTWQEVKASNPPSRRSQHTVVMDAQQQMWIFGDYGGSGTLHYFDIQAKTWQEVKASNAPSKTEGHTAVMDAQQRMWIFGGYNGNANDLHYFDIQAKTWQQVSASNPFERYYHAAVMDMQQRMWIFGGNTDDDDGTRSWNDLRYFDTQGHNIQQYGHYLQNNVQQYFHHLQSNIHQYNHQYIQQYIRQYIRQYIHYIRRHDI